MILKCVLGVVARLKSRRKKSSVFTLVGLHTRRLITTAERFRRRFRRRFHVSARTSNKYSLRDWSENS